MAEDKKDDDMLRLRDWEDAMEVGSACNLSGVVRSFAAVTERLWNEARAQQKGTAWVNRHPISVMYAEAIAGLTGIGVDDVAPGCAAYVECQLHVEQMKKGIAILEMTEKL